MKNATVRRSLRENALGLRAAESKSATMKSIHCSKAAFHKTVLQRHGYIVVNVASRILGATVVSGLKPLVHGEVGNPSGTVVEALRKTNT